MCTICLLGYDTVSESHGDRALKVYFKYIHSVSVLTFVCVCVFL